jgi:hypothetical protein
LLLCVFLLLSRSALDYCEGGSPISASFFSLSVCLLL